MRSVRAKSQHRVSMRDVAEAANVSTATVSKVLNNGSGVGRKTRDTVIEVCERLGYTLNPSVQDLIRNGAAGFSNNIAFVLVGYGFANSAYSSLLEGVSLAVEKNNLHLILARLSGTEKSYYDLPPVLRDGRVGGIVLSGAITENVITILNAAEIPYVIIGNYAESVSSDAACVELDVDRMLLSIVERLKGLSKTKTAFFLESPKKHFPTSCLTAFETAAEKNKLKFENALVYSGSAGPYAAFNLMETILTESEPPFDAIVCLNFQAAREIAFSLLAKYGRKKAERIVVATSRIAGERLPLPGIYAEDMAPKMAEKGVNMLLEIMKDDETPKTRILLTPKVKLI